MAAHAADAPRYTMPADYHDAFHKYQKSFDDFHSRPSFRRRAGASRRRLGRFAAACNGTTKLVLFRAHMVDYASAAALDITNSHLLSLVISLQMCAQTRYFQKLGASAPARPARRSLAAERNTSARARALTSRLHHTFLHDERADIGFRRRETPRNTAPPATMGPVRLLRQAYMRCHISRQYFDRAALTRFLSRVIIQDVRGTCASAP